MVKKKKFKVSYILEDKWLGLDCIQILSDWLWAAEEYQWKGINESLERNCNEYMKKHYPDEEKA